MAKKAKSRKEEKSPLPPSSQVINVAARERRWDAISRKQVPSDVKNHLEGALAGRPDAQARMFWAMMDTWPKLQSNIGDMQNAVAGADLVVSPHVDSCDCHPSDAAKEKADFVRDALEGMKGDMIKNELGFSDLVRNLVFGFYAPPSVSELYYPTDEQIAAGVHPSVPYAAKAVGPRFYGYSAIEGSSDELRLFPEGLNYGDGQEFPEHKFLVASRLAYPGHPSIAAPMRVMTIFWLAATYGVEWLMEYAQQYGVPFRWATSAGNNQSQIDKVGAMLESMGSSGWASLPEGTNVNFESPSSAGASLPQAVLSEMADKKCDLWVNGETLTSDQGSSGSRSLGEVHERVKQRRKEAVAEFVGTVLTDQLIPSLIALNFGDQSEAPAVNLRIPDPAGDAAQVDKMKKVIVDMKIPVAKDYVYEQIDVPMPEEGDELFEPAADATPAVEPVENEGKDKGKGKPKPVSAARNQGELDTLVENTMQELTGMKAHWLVGVRPFFEDLLVKAQSEEVSEEDFQQVLAAASRQLPDQFDNLNTEALASAMERAQSSAIVLGAAQRLEEFDRA